MSTDQEKQLKNNQPLSLKTISFKIKSTSSISLSKNYPMNSSTLTSLAMLKVHVDQGQDYLDYLKPFILQVLIDHKINPITDAEVKDKINFDFGMEIPERSIQLVLRRLSKKYPLQKKDHVYQITGTLPDPKIGTEKAKAERHINSVLAGLREFSTGTAKPITTDDEADIAIRSFLSQFDIQCLRAYLRGTAIPDLNGHDNAHVVLVSKYVINIQKNFPEKFNSFLVVVQGHMLANALLCPDLQSPPKTYKGVTFFLDTPLLVRLLGLEADAVKNSISELIKLIILLGGEVGVFEHTRNELENVIKGAANNIESSKGRGEIINKARLNKITKSDMLIMAGQIDSLLIERKIKIIGTPKYVDRFQIDETDFSKELSKEIKYSNPNAKQHDINSVRSIYVLRGNSSPINIEKCKAVLVTSNTGFARAAFLYGQKHQESREVSTVITDFSLANMAWLKAPMEAPSIPMREVLAFSYAALQLPEKIWDKYLLEIEKLENRGTVSARDLQILRSGHLVQDELMNLTLGEEESLSEQNILDILDRVKNDITKEEREILHKEKNAHKKTKEELNHIRQKFIDSKSRQAKSLSIFICVTVTLILTAGIAKSFGYDFKENLFEWINPIINLFLFLFTFFSILWGLTVKNLYDFLYIYFFRRFTK